MLGMTIRLTTTSWSTRRRIAWHSSSHSEMILSCSCRCSASSAHAESHHCSQRQRQPWSRAACRAEGDTLSAPAGGGFRGPKRGVCSRTLLGRRQCPVPLHSVLFPLFLHANSHPGFAPPAAPRASYAPGATGAGLCKPSTASLGVPTKLFAHAGGRRTDVGPLTRRHLFLALPRLVRAEVFFDSRPLLFG